MDEETRKRIEDYFEGYELVEFLQINISDIVDLLEDEINEHIEEIEELIHFGTKAV